MRPNFIGWFLCAALACGLAFLARQRQSIQAQASILREQITAGEAVENEHKQLEGKAALRDELNQLRAQNEELNKLRQEVSDLETEIAGLRAKIPVKAPPPGRKSSAK